MVTAQERYAGQNVQCPHCKASVGVPVAEAAAVPLPTPERSFWNTAQGRQIKLFAGGFSVLFVFGVLRSCREDAEKNRPSMHEIMQKAKDKNR